MAGLEIYTILSIAEGSATVQRLRDNVRQTISQLNRTLVKKQSRQAIGILRFRLDTLHNLSLKFMWFITVYKKLIDRMVDFCNCYHTIY